MPPKQGKKKGPVLPPKPSTVSDEQWELAHSATRLVELLSTPESSRGASAGSKSTEHAKPLANKPTAALWLWQLLNTAPDTRDEAVKAGAVEVCAKFIGGHSSSSSAARTSIISVYRGAGHDALVACCFEILTALASPSAGPQSAAIRETLCTVRPLVLPAILNHLTETSSTGVTAAAMGLLSVFATTADTHARVKKLMAAWDKTPLIAALTMEHSLPLVGGRHAAADAAAVLQALCNAKAPAEPAATTSTDTGGEEDAKAAKQGSNSGNSAPASAGATGATNDAAADASLTTAIQESILASGGLHGLLKACGKAGSPIAARSAAVLAACHLMTAHGGMQHIKDSFQAAGGLSIMLRLVLCEVLPLPAKAAAVGCLWHYLQPQSVLQVATEHSKQAQRTAAGGLQYSTTTAADAGSIFGLPSYDSLGSPSINLSRPLTSQAARSSIIAAAKSARKKSTQTSNLESVSGGTDRTVGSDTESRGGSTTGSTVLSLAGSTLSHSLPAQQPSSMNPAAVLAYQAAMASWDDTVARGHLANRSEHIIAAGCVPALLLMCCGPDGPPSELVAAAVRAAATASRTAAAADSSAAGSQQKGSGYGSGNAADADSRLARRVSSTARGTHTDLDAIAEPSQEGFDETDETNTPLAASSTNPTQDNDNTGPKSADKKKKGGKKKPAKLEPGMAAAQAAASAAVKLLAMSGATGRAALVGAGAQQVLLPLLDVPTPEVRWNARQTLLLLSLTPTDKKQAVPAASSNKHLKSAGSNQDAQLASRRISGTIISTDVAAAASGVPPYISMGNLPTSHWHRTAPLQQPPLPVLPVIPGRRPAGGEQLNGAGAAAGGLTSAGAGAVSSAGSALRPASQQRRLSIGGAGGAVVMATRMSTSNSSMIGDAALAVPPGTVDGGIAVGLSKLGRGGRSSMVSSAGGSAGLISAERAGGGAAGMSSTAGVVHRVTGDSPAL